MSLQQINLNGPDGTENPCERWKSFKAHDLKLCGDLTVDGQIITTASLMGPYTLLNQPDLTTQTIHTIPASEIPDNKVYFLQIFYAHQQTGDKFNNYVIGINEGSFYKQAGAITIPDVFNVNTIDENGTNLDDNEILFLQSDSSGGLQIDINNMSGHTIDSIMYYRLYPAL